MPQRRSLLDTNRRASAGAAAHECRRQDSRSLCFAPMLDSHIGARRSHLRCPAGAWAKPGGRRLRRGHGWWPRLWSEPMVRALPPHWVVGIESRLLDRTRAAVLATSLDGTVLYATPYCEVLYGRSPAELEGRASADFSAEPLDASRLGDIGRALMAGQSW